MSHLQEDSVSMMHYSFMPCLWQHKSMWTIPKDSYLITNYC